MRQPELAGYAVLHLPVIVLLGMLLVGSYPMNLMVIFTLYVCGLADLGYSKMPLLRHRIFTSFGPQRIPAKRRGAYYRGYKRIGLGAALNLLSLIHYVMMSPSG